MPWVDGPPTEEGLQRARQRWAGFLQTRSHLSEPILLRKESSLGVTEKGGQRLGGAGLRLRRPDKHRRSPSTGKRGAPLKDESPA